MYGENIKKSTLIPEAAVLIFTCERPRYLRRSLSSLFRAMSDSWYPVVVSEQGVDSGTKRVLNHYSNQLTHIQFPKHLSFQVPEGEVPGYYFITEHYRSAFSFVFEELQYKYVFVLEDDIEVSTDFFHYFEDIFPILDLDSTIWSISAWNDNGLRKRAQDSGKLYRSDFFPGLGWLMTNTLWKELKPKWPRVYWDEWMRKPEQRLGRVTIRPEVSRTYTFGRSGVSNGQYYKNYLRKIQLNKNAVRFSSSDLLPLTKDHYDRDLKSSLASAIEVDITAVPKKPSQELRIAYEGDEQFQTLARYFGIMPDLWSGIPRTGYQGVVSFRHGNQTIFLYPKT